MRRVLLLFLLSAVCSAQNPDPTKWVTVNNTRLTTSPQDDMAANVVDSGGLVTITQTSTGSTCAGQTTGGLFATKNFSWTYGVLKARIKFGDSAANTIYSALWMSGGTNPSTGYPPTCSSTLQTGMSCNTTNGTVLSACANGASYEIDIAEDSNSGSAIHSAAWTWASNTGTNVCSVGGITGTYLPGQWHEYELDWWPGVLQMRIDGQAFYSCSTHTFDNVPMLIIMDTEGNVNGALPVFPAHTYIDWIRVCQDPTNTSAQPACLANDPTIVFQDNF